MHVRLATPIMGTRRSVLRGLGLVGLAAMSATPSYAADFPEKAVKIIVNFPPGGPLDVIARLVAARLTTTLKQSVVVENVSGASGNIGATQVARSSPDGHTTLMSIDTPFTMTLALYPDTSVKADELRPVAVMGVTGMKINPIHYRGNAPAVLAHLQGTGQDARCRGERVAKGDHGSHRAGGFSGAHAWAGCRPIEPVRCCGQRTPHQVARAVCLHRKDPRA